MSLSTLRTLASLRARWLAHSTARALERRVQSTALIALAIGPGIGYAVVQLATPLFLPLSPSYAFLPKVAVLLAFQTAFLLWVVALQSVIRGDAFVRYVRAQPLSHLTHLLSDAAMLLAVNTPLILIISIAVGIYLNQGGVLTALHAAYLLVFGVLALFVQFAVLAERWRWLGAVLLADSLIVATLSHTSTLTALITMAVVAVVALAVMLRPAMPPQAAPLPVRAARTPRRGAAAPRLQRLRLSFNIVRRQHWRELAAYIAVSSAMFASAAALMAIWEYDSRSPYLLVIVQTLIAVMVSGLYRTLHMAHLAAVGYTGALPLSRWWWKWRDAVVVLAVGLPCALILHAYALYHSAATPRSVTASVAGFLILLLALRIPQIHTERMAIAITVPFAGVVMALTFYFM